MKVNILFLNIKRLLFKIILFNLMNCMRYNGSVSTGFVHSVKLLTVSIVFQMIATVLFTPFYCFFFFFHSNPKGESFIVFLQVSCPKAYYLCCYGLLVIFLV